MTDIIKNHLLKERLHSAPSINKVNEKLLSEKRYQSGTCYIGKLCRNQRIGWGQLTWLNGSCYEGNFEENKKHGEGKYILNDGSTYVGQFANDVRHGCGKIIWKNGESYNGEFSNDKRHGVGVYKWPDGRKYEGLFEHNMKSGYGVFHMSNGDRFEGIYKNDLRCGPGIFHYENSGEKDIGIWKGMMLIKVYTSNKHSFQYKTFRRHFINSNKTYITNTDSSHNDQSSDVCLDDLPDNVPDSFKKDILNIREDVCKKGIMETNSERLLNAASSGDYFTVKEILVSGLAHPDVSDSTGYSSVLAAVVNCHKEVLNCLLDSGADVNQLNIEGLSALSACHVLLYTEEKFVDNIAENIPKENLFNAVDIERKTGTISVRNERKLIMAIYESTQKTFMNTKTLRRSALTKSNLQNHQHNRNGSRNEGGYFMRSSVGSSKGSYEYESSDDECNPSGKYDIWKLNFYQMSMDHVKNIEQINTGFKDFMLKGKETSSVTNDNKFDMSFIQDKDKVYNAWETSEYTKRHTTAASILGYCVSTFCKTTQQHSKETITKQKSVKEIEKVIAKHLNTERKPHLQNVVDLLLERGADPNASSLPMPVLFFAVKSADVNAVQILLKRNADTSARINDQDLSPLHIAVALPGKEGIEITKLLLKYGANPNLRDGFYEGRTPLHIVCCREDNFKETQKICKLLIEHGGNPNLLCQGCSAMTLAIASGNDLIIDLLLKSNMNLSLKLTHGLGSILCVAVSYQAERKRGPSERMKMIEKLIKSGADLLTPVRISEKYPPGTVVDYAYHVFSQDRRIACTPYHALSSVERECYNARKSMLDSLGFHLRNAAIKKEKQICEEDAKQNKKGSCDILQSLTNTPNKNSKRTRRFSRINNGPGRDDSCGLRFVSIKCVPRSITYIDEDGTSKQTIIDITKRLRYCYECGRSIGIRLTPCTRCNEVFYCSKACKVKVWNERHREECLKDIKNIERSKEDDNVNDKEDEDPKKNDEIKLPHLSNTHIKSNHFLPKL